MRPLCLLRTHGGKRVTLRGFRSHHGAAMKMPIAAILLVLLLSACGQAGPLVLPDSPEAQQQEQKQNKSSQEGQ